MRALWLLLAIAGLCRAQYVKECNGAAVPTNIPVTVNYELGQLTSTPADPVDVVVFSVTFPSPDAVNYAGIGFRAAQTPGMTGLDITVFDSQSTDQVQDCAIATGSFRPSADADQNSFIVHHSGGSGPTTTVWWARLLDTGDATDFKLTRGQAFTMGISTGVGAVFDGSYGYHGVNREQLDLVLSCAPGEASPTDSPPTYVPTFSPPTPAPPVDTCTAMRGDWFSTEATDVPFKLEVVPIQGNCVFSCVHGEAAVILASSRVVIALSGAILQLSGTLDEKSTTISWNNSVAWYRIPQSSTAARLAELEGQVTDLKSASEDTMGKLKGAVAAMGRQLIATEQRLAERVREQGDSGITLVRSFTSGTDAFHAPSFTSFGALSVHNHADTHHTVGIGEFEAVLNGVQFKTRHNDYSLVEPDLSKTVEEYTSSWPPADREIVQPEVPPSVLSAGSVPEQVSEMREYFRAFKTQNESHRDYKPYFKPVMCYLEGTWVEEGAGIDEPFTSERHHIDADSWKDLNEKVMYLFNSGQKSNLENIPFLPQSFRGMKEDANSTFEPILAQWFYRITCKPLEEDVPTDRMRVRNELHVQFMEGKPATRAQLAETPLAAFELNPTVVGWNKTAPWPKGRTAYEYLDQLMYTIPGFDGPNQFLTDESFGAECQTFAGDEALNSARYSRYFSWPGLDAVGLRHKKRAFNDQLFAAQTTHSKVSPQSMCSELDVSVIAGWSAQDASRFNLCLSLTDEDSCHAQAPWKAGEVDSKATSARCHWNIKFNACVYKKCWTQRWSYAIPLEIIYLSPLTNWNPYNISYYNKGEAGYDGVTDGDRTGSASNPYLGSRQDVFFRTPAELFSDLENPSSADTSRGLIHVVDGTSTTRQVRASGHWIIFPEMGDVGAVRQRYPIFPIHEHGSTIWKEVKALEELIMGKDKQEIKDIIQETREGAYGVTLQLSGSHSHEVTITPQELIDLKEGLVNFVLKVTSTANAHQHYVQVNYDSTAQPGQEWSMDWCSMSAAQVVCPTWVLTQQTCSNPAGPVYCCAGSCPDGHSSLSVLF